MNKTSIEWTDFTSNPIRFRAPDGRVVWACVKLSQGCTNCYASALSERYTQRRAGDWNQNVMKTLTPFLDENEVRAIVHYKPASGRRVFIGDMTDVFGNWVPDRLLDELFGRFAQRPDVTFQVLTKRAQRLQNYSTRMAALSREERAVRWADAMLANVGLHYTGAERNTSGVDWPLPNVWFGVSAEDQQRANERIPLLLATPAAVRFISAEPLLGPIDLSFLGQAHPLDPDLDWVIVGGESGPHARPMHPQWAERIAEACQEANTPFFFKQWGEWQNGSDVGNGSRGEIVLNDGRHAASADAFDDATKSAWGHFDATIMAKSGKHRAGRTLRGREWNEFPRSAVSA